MRDRPYRERRGVLEQMNLKGGTWSVPDYLVAEVPSTLEATAQQGLDGLVLKNLDSPYVGGDASHESWFDLRTHVRREFVVGGWRRHDPGHGSSGGGLYLGYWAKKEGDGEVLRYAGIVSAGFSLGDLESIEKDLERFERGSSPFDDMYDGDEIQFVNPKRVVEVEFGGWDDAGHLDQAVYVGMRRDRDPGDTRRDPD
jgi:bifunctional non-homologous end joining protein LigD